MTAAMTEQYDAFDQYDETAEAPLAEDFLMQCRNRKTAIEQKNNRLFWAHMVMAGFLFVLTLFLGGVVARDPQWEGPQKFYVSFTLGLSNILTAIVTLVFGLWAHQKRRIPTYVLMIFFIAHIIYTIFAPYHYFDYVYIIYDVAGIALNYFRLSLITEHEWLQQQPGYPYFTMSLLQKSEYEPPKYVTHRRPPSDEMDTVGSAAAKPEPLVASADVTLADMAPAISAVPEVKLPPPVVLHGDAALESLTETVSAPQPAAGPASATVSADALLADMTVPETPAMHGALPDPEDVKARLRQMAEEKRAQQATE